MRERSWYRHKLFSNVSKTYVQVLLFANQQGSFFLCRLIYPRSFVLPSETMSSALVYRFGERTLMLESQKMPFVI